MTCYRTPEYAAFIAAMRADSTDRTTPLVCADWLEDHGKRDHAAFIRGCSELGRMNALYRGRDWGAEPDGYELCGRIQDAYHDLRPLINRYCHEWTGGAIRKFDNPTAHDWVDGFLRFWNLYPVLTPDGASLTGASLLRLEALLRRQPIYAVRLTVGGDPRRVVPLLDSLASAYRGVRFLCSDNISLVPFADEVPV